MGILKIKKHYLLGTFFLFQFSVLYVSYCCSIIKIPTPPLPPKQVCRTCRFRILSFPTMHQPVVGSRAKKGASNSQSLEDPLLSSCRRPLLLLLRRPRSERPSSCTAVKRPSSLCGVFRGEGCEEEEEAGTLCMCVCVSSEDATRLLQLDASSSSNAASTSYCLLGGGLKRQRAALDLGPKKTGQFRSRAFLRHQKRMELLWGDSSSGGGGAAFTKKSMYVTSKETHTYTHSNVLLHNTSTN